MIRLIINFDVTENYLSDHNVLKLIYLNFRLGAHGFIFMGGESSAPGNAGLLDQVRNK